LNAMDGGAAAVPSKTKDSFSSGSTVNLVGSLNDQKDEGNSLNFFPHCVAILHSPLYFAENGGAMRLDPPRIPIPINRQVLVASASIGETLVGLLDISRSVPNVSSGRIREGLRSLGLPSTKPGKTFDAETSSLMAGWGYFQTDRKTGVRKTMAGQGNAVVREYTPAERAALESEAQVAGLSLAEVQGLLGVRTVDAYLNLNAWWSNIPQKVWEFSLGGYQVLKKWLSYRERPVLGRPLNADEIAYVAEMVRRISAILLMGPILDANYRASAADAQSYENLGISRDAVRERKEASTIKRGASNKLTPAMKDGRKRQKNEITKKESIKGRLGSPRKPCPHSSSPPSFACAKAAPRKPN
jgi:hypothetical protein